ncbi:MAG: hypothetical protein ACREUF_20960 [Solimonas sp.]
MQEGYFGLSQAAWVARICYTAGQEGFSVTQRDDFQCSVKSMGYDFETRVGTLNMAEHECCDMSGCIAFFTRIDPDVVRINTFSGSKPDTAYLRSGGQWQAMALEHAVPPARILN